MTTTATKTITIFESWDNLLDGLSEADCQNINESATKSLYEIQLMQRLDQSPLTAQGWEFELIWTPNQPHIVADDAGSDESEAAVETTEAALHEQWTVGGFWVESEEGSE